MAEDAGRDLPGEDQIFEWLSQGPRPESSGPIAEGATCPACGYDGDMHSHRGRTICPACYTILPFPPVVIVRRVVPCPNCDQQIGLSDADRNRTIVCPRCSFFLGCVYRGESARHPTVFGIPIDSLTLRWPFRRQAPR